MPQYLDQDTIDRLAAHAIDAGLAERSRRSLLFAAIPRRIAASAEAGTNPAYQVRADLNHLNGLPTAPGAQPHLLRWLRNAVNLVGVLGYGAPFEQAIQHILNLPAAPADLPAYSPPEPAVVGEGVPTAEASRERPVRVCLFSASARDHGLLDFEAELRGIKEAVALAGRSTNEVVLEHHPATRVQDLVRVLADDRVPPPDIVHFSGHIVSIGRVVLRDRQDELSETVSVNWVRKIMGWLGPETRLIVLNACFSAKVAEPLSDERVVVGSTAAIPDADAIRFSALFYRHLMDGLRISRAFDATRATLEGERIQLHEALVIYPKDGGGFRFF